jgi:cobalt-zinc-cadmium efflux system outer membrane protein
MSIHRFEMAAPMLVSRLTRISLCLLLMALQAQQLPAEPPRGLTLADLERMARENHPLIRIASSRVEAAAGQRVQSGLYPNTHIGYHATEVGNLDSAGAQGFFLSQKILQRGKRKLDMAVADEAIERSRFDAQAMEARVINDVRLRFYDALAARSEVKLAKELVRISTEAATASKTLLEAEQVGENVLLLARLELETTRILLDNARTTQYEAWRRLCAVTGVDDLAINTLVGSLEVLPSPFSWQQTHADLIAMSPELAAAHAAVAQWKLALERAEKQTRPDLDVMLSLRHHNLTSSEIANIQIGFPIPYLDRNQGNIRTARANWITAEQRVRQIELRLTDQLATAYQRYDSARRQVARYQQQIIPLADRSIELVQQGYHHGQLGYLQLLTTQRTYFQVKMDYLKSLSQLHSQSVLLKGKLLSGSLKQP